MILTARFGYSCAAAGPTRAATARAANPSLDKADMSFLPVRCLETTAAGRWYTRLCAMLQTARCAAPTPLQRRLSRAPRAHHARGGRPLARAMGGAAR